MATQEKIPKEHCGNDARPTHAVEEVLHVYSSTQGHSRHHAVAKNGQHAQQPGKNQIHQDTVTGTMGRSCPQSFPWEDSGTRVLYREGTTMMPVHIHLVQQVQGQEKTDVPGQSVGQYKVPLPPPVCLRRPSPDSVRPSHIGRAICFMQSPSPSLT